LQEPEAILFDLDDTIIAWDAVSGQVWAEVCHRCASRVTELEADKLLAVINETRDWYWNDPVRHSRGRLNLSAARREVVAIALAQLDISDPALASEIADSYSIEREKAAFLVPGAIDTLNHFRNRGCRLALVSNGSSEVQRSKIKRFKLASLFDCILIEGEIGSGKPDTRIFLHALEKLNTGVAKAWMIGDDLERDVAAAQRLKIFSIWVDWRNEGLPELTAVQPDRIIRTLSDLL